ncbi:glycosyltransferase family 4 protein [Bradyrhizobium japonicum]|uniref:glycosyltransferase family 4 protein n=1 Tax=Bradyrhizobium japonicum TaxID=375 RepID=UPI0020A1EF35|nr:glycosyltransferase family 4 protein [Bradyrhizobium japonicum]MCP1764497.1 glycosyltransferase involved in cell wall biosynthesis [Bradyrhizobium japonicum]MCP1786633.1 glycosyltransferase involved in cell wall biosynthesis [Bradyrhizobium japonicum]MCP1808511.1 glycosyltransferase involved in cell wall biosynthesis [Bradyrhizobium japonicum]MCP1817438.1 glycosyltransferase involved in cell wall biosynthesis [Bradyrhizobium japonicum]MCP1871048.1 glycosyltransferase involved in cell wall b
MQSQGKIVVASQHYPPDPSTTAAIMAEIACRVAVNHEVIVLSGSPGELPASQTGPGKPRVIAIKNRMAGKAALVRRGLSELLFAARTFFALIRELRAGDVVVTVTAPFMLPYAVAAAARCKGARSALIMHDLFPDVLVMAEILKPGSFVTRTMRAANSLMFRALNAVITIGRDAERPLLSYSGMTRNKIRFIPNWATLVPAARPLAQDNPFRKALSARFIVGLSGNLGFTHDPDIVFEAARLLKDELDIHFLLSGWGIGFERLKQLQAEANLPNVSFVARVADAELEAFLAAANLWIIPYRKDVAGVSVPSRFYNLLAVGRPVALVSEPEAEAALTVVENGLGWVVTPGRADQLADAIRAASRCDAAAMAERAVKAAGRFDRTTAMNAYAGLIDELLRNPDLAEQR